MLYELVGVTAFSLTTQVCVIRAGNAKTRYLVRARKMSFSELSGHFGVVVGCSERLLPSYSGVGTLLHAHTAQSQDGHDGFDSRLEHEGESVPVDRSSDLYPGKLRYYVSIADARPERLPPPSIPVLTGSGGSRCTAQKRHVHQTARAFSHIAMLVLVTPVYALRLDPCKTLPSSTA